MSLARFSRQSHRWLSIVFTLTVVLNFAWRAAVGGEPRDGEQGESSEQCAEETGVNVHVTSSPRPT